MDTHTPDAAVTFIELAGPDAAARLAALAASLAGAGVATELLTSADQADLHLLVCRNLPAPPEGLPEAARVWRFFAAQATPQRSRGG